MRHDSGDVQSDRKWSRPSEFIRRAAKALGKSDDYFRDVLEALPVAIYTTDAAGRITFYNETAVALWGRRPTLGDDHWCGSWKLYRPDGSPLPHDECPMAVTLKEGRPVRDVEAVAERPDGSRVPFLPFPTPLFDASGALVGAVNMLMDLSDRKRAEQYEQRLGAIVESSDDAIVSKNLNGIITSWNRGAERLFGYASDEVVGQSITILIPPERLDEETMVLDRIRRGERIDHFETVRRRKDGSLVDISLTVSPVRDAGGRIVGASKIARDITERRRAQEQQELLIGEIKHRIKNTLATVQAIAMQTLRSASADERSAFIARLHALANAHDLLTLESWNRAPLRDVVGRVLQPFQEKHRERFLIEGHGDLWLSADRSVLLALVLHELATNAVKYGALSNGSGRVRVEWEVGSNGKAGRIMLTWKESGGPPVKPPEHKGFGSLLIERVVAAELGAARFAFLPQGVTCTFEIAL
jgi:two-component system, chemotaxis family, CheB/CheR fusion protein